ncbi:MAG TPA: HEAT repeat domain-containing protein [Candidatus Acidoferrales bacterium]
MRFAFDRIREFGPAGIVLEAILASMVGITLLVAFILLRRAWRRRQFRRREERALAIRGKWEGIVSGRIPAANWRFHPIDREIIQSILLDALEVSPPEQAAPLLRCLRNSGLFDTLVHEARTLHGWRRNRALLALGRTRAPEAIAALGEGLDSRDAHTRLDAVRAMGRTGLPEAAIPILERLVGGELGVPVSPLQNALLNACRPRPAVLLPFLRRAPDEVRPLLARVLGEIANEELGDELLVLVHDKLAEVRAAAARALGRAKPRVALSALATLGSDKEWFVRLRAVVALGELRDPLAIPMLIATLCDSNRLVRLRSAAALAQHEEHLAEILELVQRTGDRYALHALVSELERSGGLMKLIQSLIDPERMEYSRAALTSALRAGTERLLLDALAHHAHWRVRLSVARLLANSGKSELASQIESMLDEAGSSRQQRVMRWVVNQLRSGGPPEKDEAPEPVSA